MGEFRWTVRREQAALLVAQDSLSNEEIAAEVGVSRQAGWEEPGMPRATT